jgi:peptide/nickel transport system permease protein
VRAASLWRYAFRRVLSALPALAGVVVVTFVITRMLPGDPALYYAGQVENFKTVDEVRHRMGLDRSLPEQFVSYLEALAHGDLGQSLSTGQSVGREIMQRLPASFELMVIALGLGLLIAIPLGVLAAARPGSWIDHACRLIGTAGVSLPTFFTGLLLIYVFYYLAGWAPAPVGRFPSFMRPPPAITGMITIDALLAGDGAKFAAACGQIALPALTMAIFTLAPLARMTRASMLGVLSSDFVRQARANGAPRIRLLFATALRNGLLPVVTTLGMIASSMLGANVLVERVFAWPGVGSYALDAMVSLDYAPLQGFVLVMSVIYVLINLGIDLLYGVIDPRVRFEA